MARLIPLLNHLALVAVMLWAHGAAAQISVRTTQIGRAEIQSDDAPPGPEVAKVGMSIFDLEATFPLSIHQDESTGQFAVLENTLGFRSQKFTYDWPAEDTEYKPDRVYGFRYGLNYVRSLGSKWRVIAFADGGIYSDMEDFGVDDLYGEGGVLFMQPVGDNWQLGAGPVFTYAFGNPLVIPAPYVRYTGQGRFLVDIRVPQHVVVAARPSQRLTVGVALRSVFNNYSLSDPQAQDIDGESTSIVFSDITAGVESRYALTGMLSLELNVSTTLDRTFEINDHRGDRLYDRGLKDAVVASVALTFGPQ